MTTISSLTHRRMMKMITKKVKISQNRNELYVMSHFLRVIAMWSCDDYSIAHVRYNLCQMEFQGIRNLMHKISIITHHTTKNVCIRKWQKKQHESIDRNSVG